MNRLIAVIPAAIVLIVAVSMGIGAALLVRGKLSRWFRCRSAPNREPGKIGRTIFAQEIPPNGGVPIGTPSRNLFLGNSNDFL